MATVLVVEDDEAIREAVAFNLKRDGHEVLTASDGAEGLARAREASPDLVVLDVMLPRMSGLDVCRLLREETPIPILMLTARDAEADVVQGLDLGADEYVTKPFSMRELRARVTSLLRRDQLSRDAGPAATTGGGTDYGEGANEDVVIGGIGLSPSRHEVSREGVTVSLRPREFALLEFLMRHPGQVFTRDVILERVWGMSYPGETRTVDVHVRWLREKLEEDPSQPRHIITVRSVGYKFVP
ncbi:MAG: DNA-binding response regulator [Chloroflexi bacterium]|nr:response regulator transcription factor [Chloroflexota bacterium]MQC18730.1 DNA-binding response regulator [Chloroflexota bacterium]